MQMQLDFLILGSGWTSTFLIPLLKSSQLSYAATTRSGGNDTIPFAFDVDIERSELETRFRSLPDAHTILITFPIVKSGASKLLVELYSSTRAGTVNHRDIRFIQLGTTSMWGSTPHRGNQIRTKTSHQWFTRHSSFSETDRSKCETEFLSLPNAHTTVLNLSGLYGGARHPKNWIPKVASTKDIVRLKGSLHLLHGDDLAKAIVAVHQHFSRASGQRWILTDLRVYDWWEVILTLDEEENTQRPTWIRELMNEPDGPRALPRPVEDLGRALDSREFWQVFDVVPRQKP
ncbi:hypothetical protein DL96DRAFT_1599988 [Flagelloscypha sp. PMI_526]|nr:hypothetical protein DL96DRAFT_1599988 [Flagelloscypha sp. PMI_526]